MTNEESTKNEMCVCVYGSDSVKEIVTEKLVVVGLSGGSEKDELSDPPPQLLVLGEKVKV